jgi:hypothetical protein
MSYMTMEEQIASHLTFLKNEQLTVDELLIDKGFVRCDIVGTSQSRGELCYQTKKTSLRNGLVGLATWLRSKGGEIKTYKTYGLSEARETREQDPVEIATTTGNEAIKNAQLFWHMSDQIGESEYLLKKGVGYYGIRFPSWRPSSTPVSPGRPAMTSTSRSHARPPAASPYSAPAFPRA